MHETSRADRNLLDTDRRASAATGPSTLASFLLATLFAVAIGCGEGDEKQQKAKKEGKEAIEAIGDLAGDRVEKFMKALSDNFSDLDDEIAALKTKLGEKTDEASEKLSPLLEKAEQKRVELAEKMAEMQEAGSDEMKRLQGEVQKIYAECERLVQDALKKSDAPE